MKNSAAKWQLVIVSIAVVLSVATIILLSGNKGSTQSQTIVSDTGFGGSNFNVMKVDSFVALTNRAYKGSAVFSRQSGKLMLDIKEAGGDFINGNESLLQFDFDDYGFQIKYNKKDPVLHVEFRVDGQQGIPVPNDILIPLVRRVYNSQI